MAFLDFSDRQFIKTVDTGEEVQMGFFQTTKNMQLAHIRPTIHINGKVCTTEKLRMNIYSDMGYTSLLYQSAWADLNQIPTTSLDWIGWIRLDFNRENINKELRYYPTLELSGYTRVVGVSYIGFCYDFPFPIYDNLLTNFYEHPLQMQIFGYVDRRNQ